MGFLNEISIRIFQGINPKGNSPLGFDKTVLRKIIDVDDNDGKIKDESFRNILNDVVYFVINITDMKSNKRKFIAGLNWNNLNKIVKKSDLIDKTFIEKIANKRLREIDSEIVLFSFGELPGKYKKEDKIFKQWDAVWKEYYYLTEKYEKKKLLTFNQWLLKYVENPLNVGVYWGEESSASDKGYYYLGQIDLAHLDLKKLDYQNWQKEFSNVFKNIPEGTIEKLNEKFRSMEPQAGIPLDINTNITFSLYFLLRSYGCWGGNAFYSIPINYGKGKYSGVLSICTKKPMNENLVHRWSLVANKLFRDVSLTELHRFEEHAIKSGFAVLNARTTSHNTGSHILTNDLSIELNKAIQSNNEDEIKRNLEDLFKFQNYIRQRMLYNSDIAAAQPSFDVSYSLKEIKEQFESLTIVKKFISGYEKKEFGELKFINDGDEKLKIALSNGILGMQAMFVIFENIIRNFFKHAGDISVNLKEKNEIKKLGINIFVENISNEFLKITLSDGSTISIKKLKEIKSFIKDPILDDRMKLRPHGLGFLEMKGAICYLNNIRLENIDKATVTIKSKSQDVFSVSKNIKNELQYHFYVRKPKEILILDNLSSYDKKAIGILNQIGIFVKEDIDINNNERHKFLIIANTQLINKVKKNLAALPHRIFILDNNDSVQYHFPKINNTELQRIILAKTIDEVFDILYPKWSNYLLMEKKIIKGISLCYGPPPFKEKEMQNGDWQNKPFNKRNVDIIYFDNHENNIEKTSGVRYYEPLVSLNPYKDLFNNCKDQPPYFWDETIEFAITKIAILDERMQNRFGNDNTKNNALLRRKIFIPMSNLFDLNKNKYDDKLQGDVFDWIKNSNDEEPIDYLIIHLGIIEKFLSNLKKDKVHENVENFVNNNLLKNIKIRRIVITSERGTPENIPDNFLFVHFSNLNYNIVEVPSKFSLTKTLFSARKKTKA